MFVFQNMNCLLVMTNKIVWFKVIVLFLYLHTLHFYTKLHKICINIGIK